MQFNKQMYWSRAASYTSYYIAAKNEAIDNLCVKSCHHSIARKLANFHLTIYSAENF